VHILNLIILQKWKLRVTYRPSLCCAEHYHIDTIAIWNYGSKFLTEK